MYHTFIFQPLYNGLVGLMDLLPWIDVGMAVILFTVIVRLIIFPLSKSALLTQVRMKAVEPEANKIKEEYKDNRQLQGLKIMELYRSKGIKPFSGVLLLFIQLPILLALISVFYKIIPTVDPSLLYSFIHVPAINPHFLGLDLTRPNIILSLLTAIVQYFQMHFSLASRQYRESLAKNGGKAPTGDFSANLAGTMNSQMKYLLPVLAFVSTYWVIPVKFPGAASIIALYWATTSLFTLGQELYIRKKHLK
jgi:YidC/Oxa1 family membrane protein insertase